MRSLPIAFLAPTLLLSIDPLLAAGADPLKSLEQSRSWTAVRLTFIRTSGDAPMAPRFYQATACGHDYLLSDRGDAEGVVARYADGTPQPYGYGPFFTLSLPEETWHYGAGQIRAEVFRQNDNAIPFDPRSLGLSPNPHGAPLQTLCRKTTTNRADISVSREAGFEIVRRSGVDSITTWRLDVRRGGQPVRVTLEMDGRNVAESRSDLDQFDGIWFPVRVEYYRESYRGGHEPYEVIEVQSLEIGPPDAPPRLTPACMGVDAGVNVYVHWLSDSRNELLKWDGAKALTLAEYAAADIQPGPLYLANCELADIAVQIHQAHELKKQQNQTSASKPAHGFLESLTQWETQTAHFISRYHLDSEQDQRARAVLRECQEMGELCLARHAQHVDEWRRLTGEMAGAASAPAELTRRAAAVRNTFMAPLEQLTATRFWPRLMNLPSRAQRKRVEISFAP